MGSVYVTPDGKNALRVLEVSSAENDKNNVMSLTVDETYINGISFLRRGNDDFVTEDDVASRLLARITTDGNLHVSGNLEIGGDVVFGGTVTTADKGPWITRTRADSSQVVVLDPDRVDRPLATNVGIGTDDPRHKLHIVGGGIVADSFSGTIAFSDLAGVPYAGSNTAGLVSITDSTSNTESSVSASARSVKTVRDMLEAKVNRTGDTVRGNLRLDNGGYLTLGVGCRLGVGTPTPSHALDVVGDLNFSGNLLRHGVPYEGINPQVWKHENGRAFVTGSNVGIGTDDPQSTLQVEGDIALSGDIYQGGVLRPISPWKKTSAQHITYDGPGNVGIGIRDPTFKLQVQGAIYASGGVTEMSDANLKADLLPITGALDKISSISGYTYTRTRTTKEEKEDNEGDNEGDNEYSKRRFAGVLAQDVQAVFPEVVTFDETRGTYGVNYGNMVPLLIEAVKELQQRFDLDERRQAR